MIVKCIYCDTTAKIKNNNIFMLCLCDDEFRITTIDKIKSGNCKDKIYLLEDISDPSSNKSNEIKIAV
jgi:uncharacterized protein YlaI